MSLPTELWRKVFHHATAIPTTALDPLAGFARHTVLRDGKSSYDESQTTKLALSLVSKLWHVLAVELLFSHVVIRHVHGLNMLVSAMEKYTSDDCAVKRGWWTRYIEFRLIDLPSTGIGYEYVMEAICRAIVNCPNLVAFLDGTTDVSTCSPIIPALTSSCSRTLKHVQWQMCGPDPAGLGSISLECNGVTSLQIIGRTCGPGWDASPEPLAFPNLRSLDILASDDGELICMNASMWALPSLTHLVLRIDEPDTFTTSAITSFLSAHGPKLTSLQLAVSSPEYTLPVDLAAVLSHCPKLDDLVLDFAVAEQVEGTHMGHATISRIGIRDRLPESYPRSIDVHVARSLPLSLFPALRQVCVLPHGEENRNDGLPSAKWKAMEKECRGRGVAFSSENGEEGKEEVALTPMIGISSLFGGFWTARDRAASSVLKYAFS